MSKKVISTKTSKDNLNPAVEAAIKEALGNGSRRMGNVVDTAINNSENIAKLANSSDVVSKENKKILKDHYGNSLASVGNQDRVQSFTNYGFSADTLNWPLWLALYNDSWVFRRAIDKPAQDMVTAGFTLHGDRDYTPVYKLANRYKNDLTDIATWGALFGGSVGVFLFEGVKKEDLAKPLKKEMIKGKRFKLYTVDRWYGVSPTVEDLVNNMKDIDFGKPRYYNITMADGTTQKVHHSWVLRYEHRTAPKLIKNGQLQGWGYAEGSHIINELARDDQLKTSITSLVNKALIEVVKMSGMRGVFMGTDLGNETQLRKRLEMVNWARTYNSITLLDKDDEYQQYQLTGLTGLADLMEKNMWLISSALEMQGILFGDLKGGLSQESDAFARYAKTILRRSDSLFRPVLYKFLKILFIVLDYDEAPDFDFNSLDKAEENKRKVASLSDLSNMLSKLTEDGIISTYQYAKTLKNFMNDDVINLEFSDELLNKLKLEEEQAILDTIKDIGKKRDRAPNMDLHGNINMNNPFGEVSQTESIPVREEIDEVQESTEGLNGGERIENEEGGERM